MSGLLYILDLNMKAWLVFLPLLLISAGFQKRHWYVAFNRSLVAGYICLMYAFAAWYVSDIGAIVCAVIFGLVLLFVVRRDVIRWRKSAAHYATPLPKKV